MLVSMHGVGVSVITADPKVVIVVVTVVVVVVVVVLLLWASECL
jgi:flagellar biosynthesis/type III secretory pathway M-ring protein FliF/YscJ